MFKLLTLCTIVCHCSLTCTAVHCRSPALIFRMIADFRNGHFSFWMLNYIIDSIELLGTETWPKCFREDTETFLGPELCSRKLSTVNGCMWPITCQWHLNGCGNLWIEWNSWLVYEWRLYEWMVRWFPIPFVISPWFYTSSVKCK